MTDPAEHTSAKFTRLAVGLTLLVCAAYYGIGSYYGPEGHPAVISRDAYLFHQYARQLSEGHPYQFNTGEAPTTACTSHLYPAMLAAAYGAGARGAAIQSAAFLINAVLMVGALALFSAVMRRLDAGAAPLAVMLFALSGQIHITTLDQMDSALFLCVSLGMLAAAVCERWRVLVVLAFVAPWCRPEGVILSFFLLTLPWLRVWGNRSSRNAMVAAGAAGLTAQGLVMLLNFALTGTHSFHSVIGKSPFLFAPPMVVVGDTIQTLGKMVRELGLGLADNHRQFILPPVLGMALVWVGLMSRNWRLSGARAEACWLASIAAALLLVAGSGWEGIRHDRYITWMTPILTGYMAMGAMRISEPEGRRRWRAWLIGGLLAWQAAGGAFLAAGYWSDCVRGGLNAAFCRSVDARLPAGTRMGMNGGAGIKYLMPNKTIVNIQGIVTPEFAHRHPVETNLEILKHKPSVRFDYWLLSGTTSPDDWFGAAMGRQILAEVPAVGAANSHALYRADWGKFDAALAIRGTGVIKAVEGMKLVDSLDVGWIEDEEAHEYEVFDRLPGTFLRPFVKDAACGGTPIFEVGRAVIGSESFRVKSESGKGMRIVMRTSLSGQPLIHKIGEDSRTQEFNFASPLGLVIIVDKHEPLKAGLTIKGEKRGFAEAVVDIPASLITGENTTLTVGGDHLSFGYWFFQ